MPVVIGPGLSRGQPAAVPVGLLDAERERFVLDREQELVELTAHAACKGSISQLVNRRFEPLERPINRGFRMLAHRSIREPSSVPEVSAQNCTLWPTAVSLPDRSSANSVCATGGGEACSNGRGGSLI